MTQDFNDTICMDLKVWPKHNVIILYIIDMFSRFTAAFIIPDKRPESIIKPFLESWILTRFGAPKSILTDNGGEFVNKKMTDLCHNFNIRIFTTAGHSPYQNGICERNHSTVDEIIDRMMSSGRYSSVKAALGAAIFAKNIRTTSLGFSPHQIVFGSNPRIPGAIENEPPAEMGISITSLVQRRLQSIFDARRALSQVDNKHRLRMAEKASHTGKLKIYNIGDLVYYRLGEKLNWAGPGKIIAQDNKLIFVRHGRNLIVASPNRIQLAYQQHKLPSIESKEFTEKRQEVQKVTETVQHISSDSDSEEEEEHQTIGNNDVTEPVNNIQEEYSQQENSHNAQTHEEDHLVETSEKTSTDRVYPKAGNYIFMRLKGNEGNSWDRVKIWQRVTKGKQSPYGPYYNWELKDGTKAGGYIDNYEWHFEGTDYQPGVNVDGDIRAYIAYNDKEVSTTEEDSLALVTFIPKDEHNSPQAMKAKNLEIEHFKEYGVYKEVDDIGQPRITSGWVLTKKVIEGRDSVKARLICHGNQQSIWNTEESARTDSPTVKRKSIKVLIAMAAQHGWTVKSQDVTAAFLQAKDLVREVYVQPPKEICKEGKIWKLIKPMYGLDEASYLWYETLKEFLLGSGCEQLMNDPAVFFFRTTKLEGMLTTHVDDLFSTGSDMFEERIRGPMLKRFKFGAIHVENELKVLGLNISHKGKDIFINQNEYIYKKIEYVNIKKKDSDNINMQLTAEDKRLVWQAVGKCRWICDQTRPDICYDNLELSIKQRHATHREVKQLNSMIKRAKEGQFSIRFAKIPGNKWHLSVFVDASLRGLPDKIESAYGWIIFIGDQYRPGEDRVAMPIEWSSGKLNRTVTSTYEAESIALTAATEEAIQLKKEFINLIGCTPDMIDIQLYCDCHDVVASIFSTKDICKSVRVRSDIGRMKQIMYREEITSLAWVPSELQLANALTKSSASKVALVSTLMKGSFQ